jgi:hypothetical protein
MKYVLMVIDDEQQLSRLTPESEAGLLAGHRGAVEVRAIRE